MRVCWQSHVIQNANNNDTQDGRFVIVMNDNRVVVWYEWDICIDGIQKNIVGDLGAWVQIILIKKTHEWYVLGIFQYNFLKNFKDFSY